VLDPTFLHSFEASLGLFPYFNVVLCFNNLKGKCIQRKFIYFIYSLMEVFGSIS